MGQAENSRMQAFPWPTALKIDKQDTLGRLPKLHYREKGGDRS